MSEAVQESVLRVHSLESLRSGVWSEFSLECVGTTHTRESITLHNPIYPFLTVLDLKRLVWMEHNGDPKWAPDRVFLAVQYNVTAGNVDTLEYRPLDFHWPLAIGVELPDPLSSVNRKPHEKLVDEHGDRFPNVRPVFTSDMTLSDALSLELTDTPDVLPAIVAISLAAVLSGGEDEEEDDEEDAPMFGGFYQLYFPKLKTLDVERTPALDALYGSTALYMKDRLKRIERVETHLSAGGTEGMTMTSVVRIRWSFPAPTVKPDSLERTFYELQTSKTIPFLRFFPANGGTPVLKLGVHTSGPQKGLPFIQDNAVLKAWLHQTPPQMGHHSLLVARIPLTVTATGVEAFTLSMHEDGSCDIRIEVAHRGTVFQASIASAAERVLRTLTTDLGFPEGTVPLLRDLAATYTWTHPNPRASQTARSIHDKLKTLTPFLELESSMSGMGTGTGGTGTTGTGAGATGTGATGTGAGATGATGATGTGIPLATCVWRAVSNFDRDSAQLAFIAEQVRGQESGNNLVQNLSDALIGKFGLSEEEAKRAVERWFTRATEAVAPAAGAGAGAHAVAAHSVGAFIKLFGSHPSYTMQVQGVSSWVELRQIVSVVGVLLGSEPRDLALLPRISTKATAKAVAEAAKAAKVAKAAAEAAKAAAVVVAKADENTDEDTDEDADDIFALLMGRGSDDSDEEPNPSPSGVQVLPPAPAAAAAAAESDESTDSDDSDESDESESIGDAITECHGNPWKSTDPPLKIPAAFYMIRLKELDNNMFGYKGVAGQTSYSKSCQHSGARQPNAMTAVEYERVKRCYDGRVRIVNLPPQTPADLEGFTLTAKQTDKSQFLTDPKTNLPLWTVYGYESKTQPGTWLYLICAEFWCMRDNLPLLKSEFKGVVGRGFSKKPDTCPFCEGRLIRNTADKASKNHSYQPQTGESVLQRIPNAGATSGIPLFIGSLKNKIHPKKYDFIPCCDSDPKTLKDYLVRKHEGETIRYVSTKADIDTDADADAPPPPAARATVDFAHILSNMTTQYILSSDKTLQLGKIGLVSPALDRFFGQDSRHILETVTRPSLMKGKAAFLRIGVDTTTPGYNLFAALAPYMGLSTTVDVRNRLLNTISVRAFEAANYGTLLMEFAAESTETPETLAPGLSAFAKMHYYTVTTQNRSHILRLFGAWKAFCAYIVDPVRPKKLRHFEHILSFPGVFPSGMFIVTLESVADTIRIVCPSFGLPTASIYRDVRVAFLSHNPKLHVWEPLMLHTGDRNILRQFGVSPPDLEYIPVRFRASVASWIHEWRNSTGGCGRPAPPPHVWTAVDGASDALPRLSQFIESSAFNKRVTALVRDRSNRLAGILLSAAGQSTLNQVFVPCLDDGHLASKVNRVYEFAAIPQTPLDVCVKLYRSELVDKFKFKGLTPLEVLTNESGVFGFRTAAGSIVPTGNASVTVATELGLRVHVSSVLPPWKEDEQIFGPGLELGYHTQGTNPTASVFDQFNEAYQHVRLTLAHKIEKSTSLRSNILTLLGKKSLPLYERRKRMDILLEPVIHTWLAMDNTDSPSRPLPLTMTILRTDCVTVATKSDCVGACKWVKTVKSGEEEEEEDEEENGKCRIRVPSRPSATAATAAPATVFAARLSDELMRFPSKRRELMEGRVPTIRPPRGIARVGDDMFAEARDVDSLLERLGFFLERADMTFPEEMLSLTASEEPIRAPVAQRATATATATATSKFPLPKSWIGLGLSVPNPSLHVIQTANAQPLAFASGTQMSLAKWEQMVQARRTLLQLTGPTMRPLQWSIQDWFVIADINAANLLFVEDNPLRIQRWIQPSKSTVTHLDKQGFMILWGPLTLLAVRRKPYYGYKFPLVDLPPDLALLLRSTKPLSEVEVRGFVNVEDSDSSDSDSDSDRPALNVDTDTDTVD